MTKEVLNPFEQKCVRESSGDTSSVGNLPHGFHSTVAVVGWGGSHLGESPGKDGGHQNDSTWPTEYHPKTVSRK